MAKFDPSVRTNSMIGMLPPRESTLDRGMLTAFNAGTRLKQTWDHARY